MLDDRHQRPPGQDRSSAGEDNERSAVGAHARYIGELDRSGSQPAGAAVELLDPTAQLAERVDRDAKDAATERGLTRGHLGGQPAKLIVPGGDDRCRPPGVGEREFALRSPHRVCARGRGTSRNLPIAVRIVRAHDYLRSFGPCRPAYRTRTVGSSAVR